jgi:hypothetical protein
MLIEQSRKSASCSEENGNGSNSSSHRSSNWQKAREKKVALPCQTGSAALADEHKINWTVDLVAFSLPSRIDESSEKSLLVENLRACFVH